MRLTRELLGFIESNQANEIVVSINDAEVEGFARALKNCVDLKVLDLSNSKLGSQSIIKLYPALGKLTQLKTLILSSAGGVDESAAEALAQSFPESLEVLDLRESLEGDGAFLKLAEGLYDLPNLKVLNLACTEIGEAQEVVEVLSGVLSRMPELRVLNIESNLFDIIGVPGKAYGKLFKVLSDLQNLEELKMGNNSLRNEGMEILCKWLPHMHNIKNISFGCFVTSAFENLAEAMMHCPYLEKMAFTGSAIRVEDVEAIEKSISYLPNFKEFKVDFDQINMEFYYDQCSEGCNDEYCPDCFEECHEEDIEFCYDAVAKKEEIENFYKSNVLSRFLSEENLAYQPLLEKLVNCPILKQAIDWGYVQVGELLAVLTEGLSGMSVEDLDMNKVIELLSKYYDGTLEDSEVYGLGAIERDNLDTSGVANFSDGEI